MRKLYPFLTVFLTILFIIGCGGKPSANTKKETEIKPFTPPADGKITEQQKDAYIKASVALDSVMKIYSDNIKQFVDKYKVNPDLSQLADTTFLKKHPDIKNAWDELNKKWDDMQKGAYKSAGISEEEFNWIGGALTDTINSQVQKDVEKALSPQIKKKETKEEDKKKTK